MFLLNNTRNLSCSVKSDIDLELDFHYCHLDLHHNEFTMQLAHIAAGIEGTLCSKKKKKKSMCSKINLKYLKET